MLVWDIDGDGDVSADEGEVMSVDVVGAPGGGATGAAAVARSPHGAGGAFVDAGLSLVIEENLTATLNRDGGLEAMEVKGDLTLLITDPSMGKVTLPLRMGANPGVQFKTPPKISKQLSYANILLIPMYWLKTFLFGRDISRLAGFQVRDRMI